MMTRTVRSKIFGEGAVRTSSYLNRNSLDCGWYSGGVMGYHFEYDPVNKILLGTFEGELTDESAAEFYEAVRRYAHATNPNAGIWDLSFATANAVSSDFVRNLARREPAMPDADKRPRFLVAPATAAYGLLRMFELSGGSRRPMLRVVHTVSEALSALGVASPQFERLT